MTAQNNRKRLNGKVAIVTGSGAGIGRAEAILFAAQGAKVVLNDIAVKEGTPIAQLVVEQIRSAGGEAVANTDSVAEFQGAERLVKTALEAFGRLDILVNNAGITNFIPVHELTERDWDRMIAVHFEGFVRHHQVRLPDHVQTTQWRDHQHWFRIGPWAGLWRELLRSQGRNYRTHPGRRQGTRPF